MFFSAVYSEEWLSFATHIWIDVGCISSITKVLISCLPHRTFLGNKEIPPPLETRFRIDSTVSSSIISGKMDWCRYHQSNKTFLYGQDSISLVIIGYLITSSRFWHEAGAISNNSSGYWKTCFPCIISCELLVIIQSNCPSLIENLEYFDWVYEPI